MTAPRDPRRPFLTCFSTMGCTELTLPQVLTLADLFSIDCLELRSLENRTDLPAYLAEQPGGLPAVRSSLSPHPVRVLGTSFKLVGDNEAGRAALLSFGRLAEEIGTPYLRIFGGGTWGTTLTDKNYRQAVEVLNWWQGEKEKPLADRNPDRNPRRLLRHPAVFPALRTSRPSPSHYLGLPPHLAPRR